VAQIPRTQQWWVIALLVIASPIIIAFVLIGWLIHLALGLSLHLGVWCWWWPRGCDTLIVYSNSPVWQRHIEDGVLPALASRSIVLNWSERARWRSGLPTAVFRYFGGAREFNPIAVVFRPLRPARVFRFWQPYREWKHGKPDSLARLEGELLAYLGIRKEDRAGARNLPRSGTATR
jgi:hypothetical protein